MPYACVVQLKYELIKRTLSCIQILLNIILNLLIHLLNDSEPALEQNKKCFLQ